MKFKMIQVEVILKEDRCRILQNLNYFCCYFCEKIKKYIPSEPIVEYLCNLPVKPWCLHFDIGHWSVLRGLKICLITLGFVELIPSDIF